MNFENPDPENFRSMNSPGRLFEELVLEILKKNYAANPKNNLRFGDAGGRQYEVDVFFGVPPNATAVEIKYYRYSSPPSTTLFMNALFQTQFHKIISGASKGILVVSCPLNDVLRKVALDFPGVEVWDAIYLFEKSSIFPELHRSLEELFEITAPVASIASEPLRAGRSLANILNSIPPGRDSASEFEDACIEALKYLFGTDLHGWHPQHTTADELHRRDLVCRIVPNAEIWQLMVADLQSRYIVFEFKNYSDPITQYEIVTTERYLYPAALRKVAIIISPKGCSASSNKVIEGAMREHGKLIISLTVPQVKALLLAKDDGVDPNVELFEIVDQFLLALGR